MAGGGINTKLNKKVRYNDLKIMYIAFKCHGHAFLIKSKNNPVQNAKAKNLSYIDRYQYIHIEHNA